MAALPSHFALRARPPLWKCSNGRIIRDTCNPKSTFVWRRPPQNLPPLRTIWSSSCSSALLDPHILVLPGCYSHNQLKETLKNQRQRQNANSATILATSSTYFADDSSWMQQWVRWFRRLVKACWDAALLSIRGAQVLLVLAPMSFLTPCAVLCDPMFRSNDTNVVADAAWWYFMSAMQGLGPAFVKLCQWVATRRDIFPPAWCDRLSTLHDKGIPHSWQHSKVQLIQSFGEDYHKKGLEVDESSPVIGCGSAAQVYEARLRMPNGQIKPVAVKVLHPHFERMVNRDLWFMQTIADFLHDLVPSEALRMLNLPRATRNFGAILQRQSDLRIEGENLKQFRSNFYESADDDGDSAAQSSSILFPKPMDGWCSSTVLVEELVHDAIPIADFLRDASEQGMNARRELASPLLQAFLKMVFLDNFVHCDLHPGNVLIQTSTVAHKKRQNWWRRSITETEEDEEIEETKRTIVFLDAGIATSLGPMDQRNLKDLFRAVILNDGNKAGRLMVERAKYERCSQVEGGIDAFANGIEQLVAEFHDRRQDGLTLGAVRIGSLLSRVLDLCRIHGVEIDPAMASIVISTLVLEGLGRSLEPNLNLIDFAVPFVIGRGRV